MRWHVGDKVVGVRRAGRPWPSRPAGTVTEVLETTVLVAWDDTVVEDEMDPDELESPPG